MLSMTFDASAAQLNRLSRDPLFPASQESREGLASAAGIAQDAAVSLAQALSVLEAKIGRTVYHLWRKQVPFDVKRFLKG